MSKKIIIDSKVNLVYIICIFCKEFNHAIQLYHFFWSNIKKLTQEIFKDHAKLQGQALMNAAQEGNVAEIGPLLSRGADINLREDHFWINDKNNTAIVRFLLSLSKDPAEDIFKLVKMSLPCISSCKCLAAIVNPTTRK